MRSVAPRRRITSLVASIASVASIAQLAAGCGGAGEPPAHLEELGDVPQLFAGQGVAFDVDDSLVIMDGNSGLRRFAGGRLRAVSGGSGFSFGTICVDRDGTLLLGSGNLQRLARLEPGDRIVDLVTPPTTFERCSATPAAYHILPFGAATTLVLPTGGVAWADSTRLLDRTLRAPDGVIYAIEGGDIVTLGPDDAPAVVASCAEFAGGACPDLQLIGVDGAGHVHVVVPGLPGLHILDPVAGVYRDVELPGNLVIEQAATGSQVALVIASDPDRDNERSLWLLEDGAPSLLRFASLPRDLGVFVPLVDHAGTAHVVGNGTLQRVVD